MLLLHSHWDVKCLVENYTTDSKSIRKQIGLHPHSRPPFLRQDICSPVGAVDAPELECQICFCPMSPKEAFSLHCQHWYCNECWSRQIETKVADRAISIHCPRPGCCMAVPPAMIDYLCSRQTSQDFLHNVLKFVDCHLNIFVVIAISHL